MGLSEQDRAELRGLGQGQVPAVVEAIVARQIAAALEAAAEAIDLRFTAATAIEPHDPLPSEYIGAERNGWLNGLLTAASIVRAAANAPPP